MILRRRQYIISRLQVRILLHLLLYATVFVVGVALLVFLPVALEMSDPGSSEQQQAKASAAFLALDSRVWPAVVVLTLMIGGHAVLLTHRIVGPLYRFRQVMRSAAQGDASIRATIRKKDLLHDEADVLNELLEAGEARALRVDEDLAELGQALNALDEAVVDGAHEPQRARARAALERVERELSGASPAPAGASRMPGDSPPEPAAALPSTAAHEGRDPVEEDTR